MPFSPILTSDKPQKNTPEVVVLPFLAFFEPILSISGLLLTLFDPIYGIVGLFLTIFRHRGAGPRGA